MKQQLVEKLRDPKVKKKIVEITAKAYAAVFDIFNQIDPEKITETTIAYFGDWDGSGGPFPFGYDVSDINMDSEGPVFFGIHPEYEIPLRDKTEESIFRAISFAFQFNELLKQKVQAILCCDVLGQLGYPEIATVEEIYEIYRTLALPRISIARLNPDVLYTLFVERVDCFVLGESHHKSFPLCKMTIGGITKLKDLKMLKFENILRDSVFGKVVWEKNGITIGLRTGTSKKDKNTPPFDDYFAEVEVILDLSGYMSLSVFAEITKKLSILLPAIKKSYYMLAGNTDLSSIDSNSILSIYSKEEFADFTSKLRAYTDAYFSIPEKKDSINRRIRNAICLLIESDTQTNNAVATSLSIAAIEALLGEKGAEISEKLSTNVAVLLEPDLQKRRLAEEFFRKLYNSRSRTLHGELLEDEEKLSYKARHLAAAVMDAVISHHDFMLKSGFDPKSPQDLLEELKASRYRSGMAIGNIQTYNVRKYWIMEG